MKYIFITGMGRSGTTFLGNLLTGIPGATAGHEMVGNREFCVLSWYLRDTKYNREFLQLAREQIESSTHTEWYIDVNGYLQNAADEIQAVFHPAGIMHLVKNPVEVIRSIYTRRIERDIHILPKDDGELSKWLKGDRFQQICVNWRMVVETLLVKKIPVIKFEELIRDYDYFQEKLLQPFGFTLEKKRWEEMKDEKVNRTRSPAFRYVYSKLKGKTFQPDRLPPYDQWSDQQKKTFKEYCGPFMQELGYPF